MTTTTTTTGDNKENEINDNINVRQPPKKAKPREYKLHKSQFI